MGSKCCSLLQKDDLEPRPPAGVRQPHFTGLRCATLINATWPRSASSEPPRDREQTGGAENQYRAWIRCPKEKKRKSLAFPKVRQTLGAQTLGHDRVVTFVMPSFFFFSQHDTERVFAHHVMPVCSNQKPLFPKSSAFPPGLWYAKFEFAGIYLFILNGWFIAAANRHLSWKRWQNRNYSITLTSALLPLHQASPSPTS